MPYITQQKQDEALAFVDKINRAVMMLSGVEGGQQMISELLDMEQYKSYMKMTTMAISKKHKNNGVMCQWCDCVVVKLFEHQQTKQCKLARGRKEFCVEDEQPRNAEMKIITDKYNEYRLRKRLEREEFIAKKQKGKQIITATFKKELNHFTKIVMDKKKSGIELSDEYTLKQYRKDERERREEAKLEKQQAEAEAEAEAEAQKKAQKIAEAQKILEAQKKAEDKVIVGERVVIKLKKRSVK